MRLRAPTRVDTDTPVGINLGIGTALVVAAVLAAAVIPPVDNDWRFGVVAGAVGLSAALAADQWALLGVALIAWLLDDGFLVNRLGELSWHGSSDIGRMLLLVAAGTLGLLVGLAYRRVRAVRSQRRFDAALQALVRDVNEEEKRDA
jgi:hypothetical protein